MNSSKRPPAKNIVMVILLSVYMCFCRRRLRITSNLKKGSRLKYRFCKSQNSPRLSGGFLANDFKNSIAVWSAFISLWHSTICHAVSLVACPTQTQLRSSILLHTNLRECVSRYTMIRRRERKHYFNSKQNIQHWWINSFLNFIFPRQFLN